MIAPDLQFLLNSCVSIYRDDIKGFIAERWRRYRRARTEDLKNLTQRNLGSADGKHAVPDPVHRETVRTLVALLPLAFVVTFCKSQPWAIWMASVASYAIILRHFSVLLILTGYRLKLLPRVFAQAGSRNVE